MPTPQKLADPNAIEKQMKTKTLLRNGGIFHSGYDFCDDCERVTTNLEIDLLFRCCWCGGVNTRRLPGIA
jgi:hypothetical protein